MKVMTDKGIIERDRLQVREVIQEDGNVRAVSTEWMLEGEVVRRDVWINTLMPLEFGASNGQ